MIVEDNLLASFFDKCYNLNDDLNFIFNYSYKDIANSIIIKDYGFNGANYTVKVKKIIENEFISSDLLNDLDVLYMKITNMQLIEKLINFNLDKVLSISKVHIIISIEPIN